MKTAQLYQSEEVKGGLEKVIGAKKHRVIVDIPFVAKPAAVYKTIMEAPGWPYKVESEKMHKRDRAFVATIYVGALRTSEVVKKKDGAISLKKSQLKFDAEEGAWYFEGVKLVKEKRTRKGIAIPRKHTYREKVYLPMEGERKPFTDLILEWVKELQDEDPLFNFKRCRAWQITRAMTGQWNHYFRMLGENYLYGAWGKDVMSLAEYLQVHPRTLMHYLRGSWTDKPKV